MNNTMLSIVLIGMGIALGWVIAKLKTQNKEQEILEYQGQAQSAERLLEELRQQMHHKEQDLETLRYNLNTTQQARTTAEIKLEEAQKNLEEQRRVLERAEEKLVTTFQALSGESLKSNNRAFVELAKETLETVLNKAKGDLGEREESIKGIVGSLQEALKRYEDQVGELENKRACDYGSLETQIKSLVDTNHQLQKETTNLVSALRRPEVRGRWGEVTLRRVVELSGMSEHCDFSEQVSVETDGGRIRPDLIVRLPAQREIVVDSKVPLDAYMDAINANGEDDRNTLIIKHAQQVRKHMKDLLTKSYWEQFERAPEFVVMFIPGESFVSAALSVDPRLIEDGMQSRVIIATPTTLIALLRAVAYGWRQEQIAKHAQEIASLGREIYDRFQPFMQHINKTGDYLSQATLSFNKMIMSLERRVMVTVKKFRELGATGDKELTELTPVEQIPLKTSSVVAESLEEETEEES